MHELRTYYNLSEANALVPRLEHHFAELARIQQRVNRLAGRARQQAAQVALEHDDRVRTLSEEYLRRLGEIRQLGVVIDDADQGMVRFYSFFDGLEICLSWQFGESEVRHWHAVSEPPAARRSVRLLLAQRRKAGSLH